jgi:hypothetical protein
MAAAPPGVSSRMPNRVARRLRRALLLLAAGALAAGTAVAAGALTGRPSVSTGRQVVAPARIDGVWIWTRADVERLSEARGARPQLLPGVLVGSVTRVGEGLGVRRGLSPAAPGGAVAAVVRIEDDVIPGLSSPRQLTAALDDDLSRLLAEAEATGSTLREVQLDFDVPVARLEAWSDVLGGLRAGSLRGRSVWITSLPAHLEVAGYGELLAGVVDGHILQVFDTGLRCTPARVARVTATLERAAMPYRVGLGAFERAKGGRPTTDHACWSRAIAALDEAPGFAGAWVFPAGRDVEPTMTAIALGTR